MAFRADEAEQAPVFDRKTSMAVLAEGGIGSNGGQVVHQGHGAKLWATRLRGGVTLCVSARKDLWCRAATASAPCRSPRRAAAYCKASWCSRRRRARDPDER